MRLLIGLVVAAIALPASSCGPRHGKPRFGTLKADARPFHFEHGIELFAVANGMTVALLPDKRTNLVTVDVRYTVGAAEDPVDNAGMAHLAEHLTFELRKHSSLPTLGDRLADVALLYNAFTNHDETHYTATGLADQLDAILEIEAARLEFSCDHLDEAIFLRERDVVLEEEAQRAGPWDDVWAEISRTVWGKRHPYARQVGSREIADATREEACAFIEQHYTPARAILVVTGNFDVDRVSARIGKRFGPITRPASPPRATVIEPALDGRSSDHVADVDESTALVFFPAPAWGADDYPQFDVVRTYLAVELDRADDKYDWITDVAIQRTGGYRAPALTVGVSVDDPDRLEEAAEVVLAAADALRTRTYWPSMNQVTGPARASYMASWDQFLTRGGWLADFLQYTTHKWFFLAEMAVFDRIDGSHLHEWAKTHLLRDRSHVARIRPSGKPARDTRVSVASSGREHDIQPWRKPVDPEEATRPITSDNKRIGYPVVDEQLANGMRILLAPDLDSPIVVARLQFPAGSASEPADRRGLATAAAYLLDHDTDARYKAKDVYLLEWVLGLGTELDTWVDETTTTFGATGLAQHADWHVWRLFWLLDQGRYDDDDVRKMHERFAAADDDERDIRDEALRERLFGAAHLYSVSRMRSADVRKIGGRDLADFRARRYKARGATLIVTGGFDVDKMRAQIVEFFGAWSDEEPPETGRVPPIEPAVGPSYVGVRDEEVSQPRLTVAFATRSDPEKDRAARLVLTEMLRDRTRILREGMGATYGVSIGYSAAAGGSVLRLDAALDPEKAGKAMKAILAEIETLRDGAADLREDFVRGRRRALAESLADSAGALDLASELAAIVHDGLPLDYFSRLSEAIGATTIEDVAALATRDLSADRMVVVLSGRGAVIDDALAAAGVTAVMLDGD